MSDESKTREELVRELAEAHRRVAELEGVEKERRRAVETLHRREAILDAVRFAAEQFLKTSWKESLQEVLKRLGQAAEVSHVYIFENYAGPDGELMGSQRYEWAAPGIPSLLDNADLQGVAWRTGDFARWAETMDQGQVVQGDVRDFPEGERAVLDDQGIRSMAAVPIFVGTEWWGFIGFDDCVAEREWSAAEVDVLKAAGSTLGAALQRQRAEEELQQAYVEMEKRVEERTAELKRETAERERLQGEVIEAQKKALQELSTPLVPVTDEILVLPLIGTIDTRRARQIIDVLLEGTSSRRARVVILDITGVPVVDTGVANYLLQATQALRLLGAECLLVGITPEVAQTVVGLGMELHGLVTRRDLQDGIDYALRLLGQSIPRGAAT